MPSSPTTPDISQFNSSIVSPRISYSFYQLERPTSGSFFSSNPPTPLGREPTPPDYCLNRETKEAARRDIEKNAAAAAEAVASLNSYESSSSGPPVIHASHTEDLMVLAREIHPQRPPSLDTQDVDEGEIHRP